MSYENKNLAKTQTRIAYLCLCHMDPAFISRMAKTLRYGQDKIFIHVDKKVNKDPFVCACQGLKNVAFVEDAVENYWGGFNAIIATMRIIQFALNDGDYNRFVILQGQDYPLVSNDEIHNFFDRNTEIEFCRAKSISFNKDKGSYMKVCGYWNYDVSRQKRLKHFVCGVINRLNTLGIPYRKRTFGEWEVYSGWAQVALTRQAAEHVLNVFLTNHKFNRYMKHRFPVDELYIQTIIHNSEFREKVVDGVVIGRYGATLRNLTYFEYRDEIMLFTKAEDYESLKATKCLFVRKVNSLSAELLDEIDRRIGVVK